MATDQTPNPELFSMVFETSPLAIVVLDRDGRITLANAQAEKTLRLRRQDIRCREYDDTGWTGRPRTKR
jgi:PAS domain S-box-containing protein